MTKEEIISVLAELYKITGFRVSLHGADYSEIAAYPAEKRQFCRMVHKLPGGYEQCVACDKAACKRALNDKSTYIYTCRYGFTEAVSPLYNFGTLTGFLMMGQVYESDEDKLLAKEQLKELGSVDARIGAELELIPVAKADMIPSFVRIMTICAQYLTVSHAIPNNKPSVAHLAKEYISLHFHTKIGIERICREIGCSKSALITAFKKEYGTTVNSYINEVRLSEAMHLLRHGERRIGEISGLCGFADQSYFSKVFSAKYGVPPSEWQTLPDENEVPF